MSGPEVGRRRDGCQGSREIRSGGRFDAGGKWRPFKMEKAGVRSREVEGSEGSGGFIDSESCRSGELGLFEFHQR